jgi:acetylglutamate kinase
VVTPAFGWVVKLGGTALEAPGAVAELASAIAGSREPVVLVHGGGREVSAWLTRLGLTPRFSEGLRVTDEQTLEVAAAVLAGLANKRLVAALRAAGVDAMGLSALDGGIVTVEPHADAMRLGAVGRAVHADAARLRLLLDSGVTPVIASIGQHAGALLNVNADEVAGAIAAALPARGLALLSDVAGVVLDGAVVAEIPLESIDALLHLDDVRDGMIPKLDAARRAVAAGTACAWIGAWQGPGTLEALLEGRATATAIRSTHLRETAHV